MDRDTMVARIQEKLGFRSDLVTTITNALQDAQDELERGSSLPYWLLSEDTSFPITAASPTSATPQEFALPTGFIKESDEQDGNIRFHVPGGAPPNLGSIFPQKMDLRAAEEFFFARRRTWWDGNTQTIQSEEPGPTAGAPQVYVLKKNVIRIYPGLDQNYTLYWTFYASDTRLDGANVTNGWSSNAPWLLIGEAGLLVAIAIGDADAVAVFKAILEGAPQAGTQGARATFLAKIYEREIAGRRYSMGARL